MVSRSEGVTFPQAPRPRVSRVILSEEAQKELPVCHGSSGAPGAAGDEESEVAVLVVGGSWVWGRARSPERGLWLCCLHLSSRSHCPKSIPPAGA